MFRRIRIVSVASLLPLLGIAAAPLATRIEAAAAIAELPGSTTTSEPTATASGPLKIRHEQARFLDGNAAGLVATTTSLTMGAHARHGSLLSRPFQAPIEFTHLGASWIGPSQGSPAIRVRASPDMATWTEWLSLDVSDDFDASHSALSYSNLQSLSGQMRFLQYEVVLHQLGGEETSMSDLTFVFIDPGQSSKALLEELAGRGKLLAPSAQQPYVVPRTTWGCPDGESSPLWPPQYTTVTHLIVHHTDTTNNASDWPAEVRSIWAYHTYTQGWGDIGYNYLIDPNGVVYEGRAGGDNVKGAHFSCQNGNTMGVAELGTYSSVSPTASALSSLEGLLAWKCSQQSLSPLGASYHSGTALTLSTISGHRDGNPSPYVCSTTTCPGNTLYSLLPSIRTATSLLVGGGEAPTIHLISPNGGEAWSVGSPHTVSWASSGLSASGQLYLLLSKDGGQSEYPIPIAILSPGATSYSWTPASEHASATARVFVGNLVGAAYEASDWSDQDFAISGATVPNDNCTSATALTVQPTCSYTSGSVLNATASGLPKPACDDFPTPHMFDVWYKFTAVSSSQTVSVDPVTIDGDPVVSVYDACGGSLVACSDNGGEGGAETVSLAGLAVGSTYYVRVYDYGNLEPTGDNAIFGICVTGSGTSYTLSVGGGGTGQGTVTGSGINCTINSGSTSGLCSATFAAGTGVSLTATPTGGSTFSAWGGDCSGSGGCSFTMNRNRAVSASFTAPATSYNLSVTGGGTGQGTVTGSGINCTINSGSTSGLCSATFAAGTGVSLTAMPTGGSTFSAWGGDCSGSGGCSFTMNGNKVVSASFGGGGTSLPNLTPYKPSSWSDKIVVSTVAGATADSTVLLPSDSLYVSWSAINGGSAAVPSSPDYLFYLYLDGAYLAGWYADFALNPSEYLGVPDFVVGPLSQGAHTLRLVCDATNVVAESDESDNEYTKTITVGAPAPTRFFTATPCRLFDTRNASGADAAWPILGGGETRALTISGRCSVPSGAKSLSVNVTVTGQAAGGELLLYRGDLATAPTASSLSFRPGKTRANNSILELSRDGSAAFKVWNNSAGSAHFILDVNGYFQ